MSYHGLLVFLMLSSGTADMYLRPLAVGLLRYTGHILHMVFRLY